MAYPGLDGHKTSEKDKIDVLLEPKKTEVDELVDYIKRFNPTKIVVEANQNWNGAERLRSYRNGDYTLTRNEIDQLGIRIASEIDLDTIYGLNVKSLASEIDNKFNNFSKELWENYDWKSDDLIDKMFDELHNYQDKLSKEESLLTTFKFLNSREYHEHDYGSYLIGDFRLDNYRGVDVLSVYWYNWNLRLFRNLQRITESTDDRILIIYGNGHASLFRQFLETSPEYEFVEFSSLENY